MAPDTRPSWSHAAASVVRAAFDTSSFESTAAASSRPPLGRGCADALPTRRPRSDPTAGLSRLVWRRSVSSPLSAARDV
eukprot:4360088-Prymnesium_polylepis.1